MRKEPGLPTNRQTKTHRQKRLRQKDTHKKLAQIDRNTDREKERQTDIQNYVMFIIIYKEFQFKPVVVHLSNYRHLDIYYIPVRTFD